MFIKKQKLFLVIPIIVLIIIIVIIYCWQYAKTQEIQNNNEINSSAEIDIENITLNNKLYTEPYPMSWLGWNRANISLTGVNLSKVSLSENKLTLYLKIDTSDGGFCPSNGLKNYIILVGDETDMIPTITSKDCANAYSTLLNQELSFIVSADSKKFIIKGKTFLVLENWKFSEFVDLFEIIITEEGDIQIRPLIG